MENQENIVVKKDQSYYRGTRHDVFALVPANVHRVLEIGCGSGRFRQNFKDDVEYWGVEPVQTAAQEAVGLTRVLVGTLDVVSDSLPDGYFDLVVCNDSRRPVGASAYFTAEPSDDWKQLVRNNFPLAHGRGALRLLRSSRFALTQPDRFATGASTRPYTFADPQTVTILNVQGAPAG